MPVVAQRLQRLEEAPLALTRRVDGRPVAARTLADDAATLRAPLGKNHDTRLIVGGHRYAVDGSSRSHETPSRTFDAVFDAR